MFFCASCCNIANKGFYLQLFSLYIVDLPTLLQAALAEQDHANQKLQAALTAAQSNKQAVVVSVRLCFSPVTSAADLNTDMQLSNAGSA